jgi:hypothetical protein
MRGGDDAERLVQCAGGERENGCRIEVVGDPQAEVSGLARAGEGVVAMR